MSRWIVFLYLLSLGFPGGAEVLRGTFRGEVQPEGPPVSMELEDLAQVSLPAETRFTRALEIEVQIPRELIPYRSNFAVFIYQNFSNGKAGMGSTGERIALEVLPPAGKFYLQVPLIPKAGLKASVDTAVVKVPQGAEKSFPLGLTILPIDKGLPGEVQKAQFTVRTRLLSHNLGGLNILTPGLNADQRKNLKITVNGASQVSDGLIVVEPGLVSVELDLPGYKKIAVNNSVNRGKVTDITAVFEEEIPQVIFEAPEGTQILLDGKKISWKPLVPLAVEKGIHQVQFILGGYQVTDNFEVLKGGPHKVSLVLKVQSDNEN